MEDWRAQLKREASAMERSLRAALALQSDEAVRIELERLVTQPQFAGFTWLWAPALAKRDRVMFRPFILSSFDRNAVDADGKALDPWKGETGAALQALLDEVDAADDVELTKRLYGWKLEANIGEREVWWRKDALARFRAAGTPAARHVALAKIDAGAWLHLDPETAVELWKIDPKAAKKFILGHLPWGAERKAWRPVLEISRDTDREFHFELYRKIVDAKSWREDVLALPVSPDISAELQRRHPGLWDLTAAPVFFALLVKHGEAAIPYVKRHLDSIGPRWSWHGKTEGKGLPDLLELAEKRGWLELWGAMLRTSATRELFDAEVKKLVKAGNRARLDLLPGRGREFHGQGWSFALTHALTDDTACALYVKYPALVRGAYRGHVVPIWGETFPKLAEAAIAAGDHELVDFLASRLAAQQMTSQQAPAIGTLTKHYTGLGDAFITHAAAALSRMPSHGIWSYDALIKTNQLAMLLFEQSTERYLADGAAVRDLLESPQIHVQLLAFRILGQADPRANAIAAANLDLLQATLLRKLRPASRKLAFAALRNAASHDEATARHLLGKMRDALSMPDKRYPLEELVGLIGFVLQRWPVLRSAAEQPVIYGATT